MTFEQLQDLVDAVDLSGAPIPMSLTLDPPPEDGYVVTLRLEGRFRRPWELQRSTVLRVRRVHYDLIRPAYVEEEILEMIHEVLREVVAVTIKDCDTETLTEMIKATL